MIGLVVALIIEVLIIFNIKKSPSKSLYIEFYLILFLHGLKGVLGAPNFILYFIDMNNLIFLFLILLKKKSSKQHSNNKIISNSVLICVFFFFVIGIVTALLNGINISLILWSVRNYFRYILIILAVANFWKKEYTTKLYKSLLPILVINTIVSIYQYSLHIYSADNIGGILGVDFGCNSYSIVLFMIATAYYLNAFINKKENLFKFILVNVCVFTCVIIADLKAFYFLFIVEMFVILFINKVKMRNVLIIILSIIGFTIIYNICLSFYNSKNIFNVDYIKEYLTESSYSYNDDSINRTDGIQIINKLFNFDSEKTAFGLGMGAGEYNAYFSSNIYQVYESTHYYWFSYAWIYLENGFIGLILYILILVFTFKYIYINRIFKSRDVNVALAIIPTMLLLIIYNSSLRYDCAYLLYMIIGISLIYIQNKRRDNNELVQN